MIVPESFAAALAVLLFSVLCWAVWPMLADRNRAYPFEFVYWDAVLGALLLAVVSAITLGSLGEGLTLQDSLAVSGFRPIVAAGLSGGLAGLAIIALFSGMAVVGIPNAVPCAAALAVAIGTGLVALQTDAPRQDLAFVGIFILLCAAAVGWIGMLMAARRTDGTVGWFSWGIKGLLFTALSGLLFGLLLPLLRYSRSGELGLGPYPAMLIMASTMLPAAVLFSLYFFLLPVLGKPLVAGNYVRSKVGHHVPGVLAGMLWCAGFLGLLAAGGGSTGITQAGSYSFASVGLAVAGLLSLFGSASSRSGVAYNKLWVLFTCGLLLVGCLLAGYAWTPTLANS